jgi:hypothetical protein
MCGFLLWLISFSGCSESEEIGPSLNGKNTAYTLQKSIDSPINGTVTFGERSDGSILIVVDLYGTKSGEIYPVSINYNTAIEGGKLAIRLDSIDGSTGSSATVIHSLDDGQPITYEQLLLFDGHLMITDAMTTQTFAQADIGQNALTGAFEEYDLATNNGSGVKGKVTFYERLNKQTLISVVLENTSNEIMYPVLVHNNNLLEKGNSVLTLATVDGATGRGVSQVTHLEAKAGGTRMTYKDWVSYDGSVTVYEGNMEDQSIPAHGDIGQNVLTGEKVTYTIYESGTSGISGQAVFHQRKNQETLIEVLLSGGLDNVLYPVHIHTNPAGESGDRVITLLPVDGSIKGSKTNVQALDATAGGQVLTYDSLLQFNGCINVHLSEEDLMTIVAEGNMGANAI